MWLWTILKDISLLKRFCLPKYSVVSFRGIVNGMNKNSSKSRILNFKRNDTFHFSI